LGIISEKKEDKIHKAKILWETFNLMSILYKLVINSWARNY